MDLGAIGTATVGLWTVESGAFVVTRLFVLILNNQFVILFFGGGVSIGIIVFAFRLGWSFLVGE